MVAHSRSDAPADLRNSGLGQRSGSGGGGDCQMGGGCCRVTGLSGEKLRGRAGCRTPVNSWLIQVKGQPLPL